MAKNDAKLTHLQPKAASNERRVAASDLKLGMYVARLDRPWVDSNFSFQGMHITDPEEVEEIRNDCEYVYINIQLGRPADHYLDAEDEELKSICDNPKHDNVYKETTPIEEELETAREVRNDANEIVANIMEDVQSEKKLQLSMVNKLVGNILESILRNPDASVWLTKLKKKDKYTYSHCIDASTFAMVFGRHLGLPKEDITNLGMGALLFDIGKMRVPHELLVKPGRLTKDEYAVIRKHVQYSVEIVGNIKGVNDAVISVASTHHERFDGSGYPHGLKQNKIPLFGKIASIVDCYDAITSIRPYRKAISPTEALRMLYRQRNRAFQDELVEQFIQCLGVYPTGTLVELGTGEVGIIIAQNAVRRLRPKIMLILNRNKIAYDSFETLDLAIEHVDDDGNLLDISRSLQPGTYGIDPKEYYL